MQEIQGNHQIVFLADLLNTSILQITDPENEKNAKKTKKETVKLRFPEQL